MEEVSKQCVEETVVETSIPYWEFPTSQTSMCLPTLEFSSSHV
jgi:hypothetical protein